MKTRAVPFDDEGQKPAMTAGSSRPILVTPQDVEDFRQAVAAYKQTSGRLFPTCSELLELLRTLGYDKRIWKPVILPDLDADPISPVGRGGSDSIRWRETVEMATGSCHPG